MLGRRVNFIPRCASLCEAEAANLWREYSGHALPASNEIKSSKRKFYLTSRLLVDRRKWAEVVVPADYWTVRLSPAAFVPGCEPRPSLLRSLQPRSKRHRIAPEILALQARTRASGQVPAPRLLLSAHRDPLILRSQMPKSEATTANWFGWWTEVASRGMSSGNNSRRSANKTRKREILQLRFSINVRADFRIFSAPFDAGGAANECCCRGPFFLCFFRFSFSSN